MPEFTGHRDLTTYLRILWRWKVLFLVFVIGAPVVAYLIERGKPQMYRSSALVGVSDTTVDTSLLSASNSSSFSTSNVVAIAQLVNTTPVADVAARLLSPPADPGQIAAQVSATGDPTTNFLTISATAASPVSSKRIANAFASAISLNRQRAAVGQLNGAIAGVQAQLNQISPTDKTQRPQLEQELNQLRAARATQGSDAAILQPASLGAPVGTTVRRSVELGLVIGLLLAFGAIVLAENADRRLRTPEDLENITDLPLLATIASSAFSGDLDTKAEDEEAFNMLRTALTYYNVDRSLDSLVVTSPGEKDGKTTVATRLALTTARAGLRVVLVDADLRRAQVSARLGVRSATGLGAVLAGQVPLADALVDYPVEGATSGSLTVLPAGPPPPNPSGLISSDATRRVIRQLETQSDLVIVDTPAALAVSDPLPFMRLVSGVLLVARMNRSTRQTIRRLQKILTSAHGAMLGVVATGVTAGPGSHYYMTSSYSQNGTNGSEHGRLRSWRRTAKAVDATSSE